MRAVRESYTTQLVSIVGIPEYSEKYIGNLMSDCNYDQITRRNLVIVGGEEAASGPRGCHYAFGGHRHLQATDDTDIIIFYDSHCLYLRSAIRLHRHGLKHCEATEKCNKQAKANQRQPMLL